MVSLSLAHVRVSLPFFVGPTGMHLLFLLRRAVLLCILAAVSVSLCVVFCTDLFDDVKSMF